MSTSIVEAIGPTTADLPLDNPKVIAVSPTAKARPPRVPKKMVFDKRLPETELEELKLWGLSTKR